MRAKGDDMKKIFLGLVLAAGFAIPSVGEAYVGARLGLVDEDNFGYGLTFGVSLPKSFGLDFGLTGFMDKTGAGAREVKYYWTQGDVDLSYDFRPFTKGILEKPELHPYLRGGFTYAGFAIVGDLLDTRYNHGPGFNFGGGVDWALLPWLSVGVDLSESIVFLKDVSGSHSGVAYSFPGYTAKVFSVLGGVKFFAY
jgi:hypothetical protein